MRIILDIQGFKTEHNKFIVKELAAYDGSKSSHYIFKAPFPFKHLPTSLEKQAKWLMKYHHCIDWNEGFTPYHKCGDIIKSLSNKADYLYVKGEEKAEFVKKYSSKPVVEFDEQPALKPMEPYCFHHLKSPCVCALSNVFYLYNHFFMQ